MSLVKESLYFGVVVSLLAYWAGLWLKQKLGWAVLNPILVAVALVIAALKLLRVDYPGYYEGAKYISYLLTPATVCLAIPLYRQLKLLLQNLAAVALAITAGVIASALSIFVLCLAFRMEHVYYATLLPKSITTAIGMGVSEEAGGIVTITVVCIIITGIFGNIIGERMFLLLRLKSPISRGLALGTSAHAVGTAKALELGEIEGAMSSLSVAVAGLMTVVDGGNFFNTLPFVTAVVDTLRSASGFQRMIGVSGPCRPPLLGVLPFVPIGGILPMIFPTALTVRDAVAIAVQVVSLPALRPPFSIRPQGPDRQHDMSMGVPIVFVMECKVSAHPSRHKIVFDE